MSTVDYYFVDSHTHLDSRDFHDDRQEVIARAHAVGVKKLLTVGAGAGGLTSAYAARILAENNEGIWASVGVHPHDAELNDEVLQVESLSNHPKVVAIGETGLDFFRALSPREAQEHCFRKQIEIALRVKKPLIIHSRNAGQECLSILQEMGADRVGGVFHCFAEDAAFAEVLREMNFLVSFPGTISFKKADAVREVARDIPLSQIMIETDAPYMAPEPHRGKRCESSFIPKTAEALAKAKGISVEEVARQTSLNAERLFGF